jgi:hypothetical protein
MRTTRTLSTTTPTPAAILRTAADQIEARVRDLSDELLEANHRVTHYRDWLTDAVGRRTRLQRQLDAASNALHHLGMVLPSAAAIAAHPGAAAVLDAIA